MSLGQYVSDRFSAGVSMLSGRGKGSAPQPQTSGKGINPPPPSTQPESMPSGAKLPPSPELGVQTQPQMSKKVSLDLLDLSRVIDIYAESQAVQAFDAEMGKERNGKWEKVKGFFARSIQRMGRDAWIGTKKREMIEKVKLGLKNGEYTEESLRSHVVEGTEAIRTEAHLRHEQTKEEETLFPVIQTAVDAWIATPAGPERQQKLREVKGAIEASYPTVTVDMSQLESSLVRLQEAKLGSELQNIDAKLRIFDIGGIEQGNGQRKEGFFVRTADKIAEGVNNSKILPQWAKEKLLGAVRHPNTAAVLSAIGTRLVTGGGILAGSTFTGGLLAPVFVGSLGGGLFAGVRARREMRDRTAEIDRRGARGEMTGNKQYDGESSSVSHQTHRWQHPAIDLYNSVQRGKEGDEKSREAALIAGLSYLVKHRIGRERGMNMLQYDSGTSVSRQHVAMIQLLNAVFPGLVARFNSGALIETPDNSRESDIARELYEKIGKLATDTMSARLSEEKKYAVKEGRNFGLVAFGVGTTVGAAVHGLMSLGSGQSVVPSAPTPPTTGGGSPLLTPQYPGGLQAHQHVIRHHWYDNGTPAPRYDHTELMIHTDKSGGWNVSHMLSKTASTLHHGNYTITPADYTIGKIQAVITPKVGGPSFLIPIEANGNIQIPPSMQDAFNTRSFAFLEVGRVDTNPAGQILLNPIATVTGKGDMVFGIIPPAPIPTPAPEGVPGDTPWVGLPWGVNKYHELKKSQKKEPQWKDGAGDTSLPPGPSGEAPTTPKNPETPGIMPPVVPPDTGSDQFPGEDPTGLWDETHESDTPLRNEQKELDSLWNDIVKIRQTLEGRKSGDNALSESAVANLQETEKKLFDTYTARKRKFNTDASTLKSAELPEGEKNTYTNRINSLMDRGILAHRDRKPLFHSWYGRVIVAIRTKNGEIIPFYRSMNGTGGKEASKWYPCFGITDDAGWLIKGTLNGLTRAHGVKELKEIQNTLNTEFDWDPSLDNDFYWNAHRNPLVIAGGINTDFTKEAEKKQKSTKPKNHEDMNVEAWIMEWVMRASGLPRDKVAYDNTPLHPTDAAEPGTVNQVMPGDDKSIDNRAFDTALVGLSRFVPIEDAGDTVVLESWVGGNNPKDFILRDEYHSYAVQGLLIDIGQKKRVNAMRAVSAFYAKNGKIWISEKTANGMNSTRLKGQTHTGNIALGAKVSENNEYARMSHRLYEISGVNPLPDDLSIQFFHELGHQITLGYQVSHNDDDMNNLRGEINALRDDQSAGITPLSSLAFYANKVEGNPQHSVQFWEDMAELMGLYLMGREYVERYLDDRIRVRRGMKAEISEGLKDRIMNVLDDAYSSYVK